MEIDNTYNDSGPTKNMGKRCSSVSSLTRSSKAAGAGAESRTSFQDKKDDVENQNVRIGSTDIRGASTENEIRPAREYNSRNVKFYS